jgi:hypothetical protein
MKIFRPHSFFSDLSEKPGVFWWDNFGGAAFSVAIQGMDLGSYKLPLWTGLGFHAYVGDAHIDTSLDVMKQGMPDVLFTKEVKRTMKVWMEKADKRGYKYLERSIVKKYNVRRVPCKPQVDKAKDLSLHNILAESRDGLVDFYPTELMEINISSNRALCQIMRKEFDKWKDGYPASYQIVTADCNIFSRILKVPIWLGEERWRWGGGRCLLRSEWVVQCTIRSCVCVGLV